MGNTPVTKHDINKRPMSNYYSELSALFYDKKKEEIDLKDIHNLSNPPTNNFI